MKPFAHLRAIRKALSLSELKREQKNPPGSPNPDVASLSSCPGSPHDEAVLQELADDADNGSWEKNASELADRPKKSDQIAVLASLLCDLESRVRVLEENANCQNAQNEEIRESIGEIYPDSSVSPTATPKSKKRGTKVAGSKKMAK